MLRTTADRARLQYGALGHPRRVFSSVLRYGYCRGEQGDLAGSRTAADDARRLIQPDWPPEFRILLLQRLEAANLLAETRDFLLGLFPVARGAAGIGHDRADAAHMVGYVHEETLEGNKEIADAGLDPPRHGRD